MKTLILVLSGVSAVGVGSAGAYWYITSSKTVRDELKGIKLTSSLNLTPEEMKAQWQEEFNSDKDAIKTIVVGITDDNKGGEALMNWCSSSLIKEAEKSLISNVKKWCTVYTVEERVKRVKRVKRGNKVLLNDDTPSTEWEAIWTKHTTSEKRTKIGLTGEKQEGQKDKEIPEVKKWCGKSRKMDFLAKDKATVYDVVVEWCSK